MLKFLLEKEFKQIVRNNIIPRLMIVMPVMLLVILPWAANMEVRNVNLAVVDNDHSPYSSRLVRKSAASAYFRLVGTEGSYERALERQIETGKADVVLVIPPHFERDLVRGGTAQVMIAANAVNATKGALGSSYLAAIASGFAAEISRESGAAATIVPVSAGGGASVSQLNIIPRSRFNPTMNYQFYMVPALMMMLLTLLCGMIPAVSIVQEKENGTIEQINVTPVTKFMFIIAKLIPFWIIGFIVISLGFVVAWALYGLLPVGSLLTLYAGVAVYVLGVSGLGLMVSNSSSNMQQSMFVALFFMIIFLLMSGLFTPVSSMPRWAQDITIFNPLKYFARIMRMVYLKGSTMADLRTDFLALAAFAVGLNLLAVMTYRKRI